MNLTMTTSVSSSSSSTHNASQSSNSSSNDPLYNTIHAYLGPLLEKHSSGKALVYDDLVTAFQAAQKELQREPSVYVSKRLLEIHRSQLRAYEETAFQSLKTFIQSFPLPKPPTTATATTRITEESYYATCKEQFLKDKPDWYFQNYLNDHGKDDSFFSFLDESSSFQYSTILKQRVHEAYALEMKTNDNKNAGTNSEKPLGTTTATTTGTTTTRTAQTKLGNNDSNKVSSTTNKIECVLDDGN
mmetsp:Transcript_6928/g.9780  ORF Transcript_6928/g.9780 Transcript_6928/m.9780 type:complete len:244 (-) Transcript_6928:946-1677(-)